MKLNPLKCAFGVGSWKFLGFMVNQRGIEANTEKIKALLEMSSLRKTKEVMSLAGKVVALSRFLSRAMDRCAPFFDVLKGSKKFEWKEKCKQAFQALKSIWDALYLTVSKEAVSAALVREEEKVQWSV